MAPAPSAFPVPTVVFSPVGSLLVLRVVAPGGAGRGGWVGVPSLVGGLEWGPDAGPFSESCTWLLLFGWMWWVLQLEHHVVVSVIGMGPSAMVDIGDASSGLVGGGVSDPRGSVSVRRSHPLRIRVAMRARSAPRRRAGARLCCSRTRIHSVRATNARSAARVRVDGLQLEVPQKSPRR